MAGSNAKCCSRKRSQNKVAVNDGVETGVVGSARTAGTAEPLPLRTNLEGNLFLRAAARDNGRTVLAAQSFRAPFHLSKPYWDTAVKTLLVQVVNPTAGILSGDRLESEINVDEGASLLVTTPSASRVFHMREGGAESRQQFKVAAGGWLEVMPEPLVPHRNSRYHQRTEISVAAGGRLFFADTLMPGRIAHGEAWAWDQLCLETTVKVGGELVLRERFDQRAADMAALSKLAGTGETACFGNGVLVASEVETDFLEPLRALHGDGLWLGVSALRKGGWSVKWVARDGVRLRQALKQIRAVLAARFPAMACDPRKL